VLSIPELAYVFYMCDHTSPFAVYDEEKRKEEVIKSVFKETKKLKWSVINAACDKYKELTETSAVKLLKSARASVTKLEKYFRNIDLALVDDNGKPIYSAKDLVANLSKMGDVIAGLSKLEDLVKKEEQVTNANRGGVITNKYSQ
jgi:acyl-CoA reductase-like NAD-dependent aldehyde dehydrogenase